MLESLASDRWTFEAAAHLANRAGFGAKPAEIEQLAALGPERAVARYVDYQAVPDTVVDPEWAKPDPERAAELVEMRRMAQQARAGTEADRKAFEEKRRERQRMERREQQQRLSELRQWWLKRMLSSARPLEEKLTLFWHGHFATSIVKVRDAYYMWRQNSLFRKHACGPWLELLTAVSKDPAMLIWLDQAQSRREHPNENFAREVMELFALGEGHYSEKDVTEAARALTGWSLNRRDQRFEYRPAMHDGGVKTVLGQTGNLGGDDVLRILGQHPQCARWLCRKLWVFFAKDDPEPALTEALAQVFQRAGGDFRPVLRVLFRSAAFYAPDVVRTQVKSPVQWLVSTARLLDRELPAAPVTTAVLRQLGQELFAPPNVKGWDGGAAWISTNSLLARYNLATRFVLGQESNEPPLPRGRRPNRGRGRATSGEVQTDLTWLSAEERSDPERLVKALARRFLQGPLREKQSSALRDYLGSEPRLTEDVVRHAVRLVLCSPDFQMT